MRWANVKRLFTQEYLSRGGTDLPVSANRRRHKERSIWQPRYWEHHIRDEQELCAYRDDIHLNPVKHGYVQDPLEWLGAPFFLKEKSGGLAPLQTVIPHHRNVGNEHMS